MMERTYTEIIADAHLAVMDSEHVLEAVRTNALSTDGAKRLLDRATISLRCAEDAIARATGNATVASRLPMN